MDEKRDLTGVIRHFNQLLSEHSPKKLVEKSSFFTVAPPLAPPSKSIFEKCHMRARSVQLVTRLHAELATLRREKGGEGHEGRIRGNSISNSRGHEAHFRGNSISMSGIMSSVLRNE